MIWGAGFESVPQGIAGSRDYYPFIYPREMSPPTIDHPADIDYNEGTTGNIVVWTASDMNPSHYVIYQNGTPVISEKWNGSSITVEVDGLSVGIYNFTIIVYDTSGNWIVSSVLIKVLQLPEVSGYATVLAIVLIGVSVLAIEKRRRGTATELQNDHTIDDLSNP